MSAILVCANDEDPETQLVALKALRGSTDHRAIDLLLDRLAHPARALPPNDPSRSQDVKSAVIESLGTPKVTTAIKHLAGVMRREPAFRPAAAASLASIGGTAVVEALLTAVEGSDGDQPPPDFPFKLEAVRVISRMSISRLARGQLPRLRALLLDVLPEAIKDLPPRRYVLEEMCSRLDASLLQAMIDTFERHAGSAVAAEITTALARADIRRTQRFWLKAFEIWPAPLRSTVTDAFRQATLRDPAHAIAFLQASLGQASPAHGPDRLPNAFERLASSKPADVASAVARLLDTANAREVAPHYLAVVWSAADPASRIHVLDRLCTAPYKSSEARDQVIAFLTPRWNDQVRDNATTSAAFHSILHLWHERDALKPRIASILQGIALRQSATPGLATLIVGLAAALPPSGPRWDLLSSCMDKLSANTLSEALATSLHSLWHRGLMGRLVVLDPKRAAPLVVAHIAGTDNSPPLQGDDRVVALDWLGKVGTLSNFPLLKAETDTGSATSAEAATRAIASIDADAGEELLCNLLESRKPRVVAGALEGLERVRTISSASVAAIFRRTESERSRDIQARARRALENLLSRHLQARPTAPFNPDVVVPWLEVLSSFPPSQEAGVAIGTLLDQLGDREAPDVRIGVARAIAKCCPADIGIPIAERELQTERRADVVSAWEEALDALKGSPDRSLFSLVHRVCGPQVDLPDRLPPLHDIFLHPEATLPGLMQGLRRAERLLQDADSLVAQLDATAELLIDELLWSSGEEPERFDTYSNKIGRTKSINVRAMRHSQNLHNLRELAQGPHARDAAGNLRPGIQPNEAKDASVAFGGLFQEVITYIARARQPGHPQA
jgi:hypothetical protein